MLLEEMERAARIFKSICNEKNVKMFSQFDADGIVSASMMAKALMRMNKNFEIRILNQLVEENVEELKRIETNDLLVFLDMGSGQLNMLKEIVEKTNVLIIDHHKPVKFSHFNLLHLNPWLFGEDELATSILTYWFVKFLDPKNSDLVDLAIVGAIGDMQDKKWVFKGKVRKIVEEGISLGRISVIKGLRLYGRNTRPLFKALAYSFDPYIPGISGSEAQAIQFLTEIGIPVKVDERWIKLADLTEGEQRKLASAIIYERLRERETEDIFGELYLLTHKPEWVNDAREFSTLINAYSKTGRTSLALRLCWNEPIALRYVDQALEEYRAMISEGLKLLREGNSLLVTKNATYFLAKGKVSENVIGTLVNIAISSGLVDANNPVFGLAFAKNGKIKISARKGKREISVCDILLRVVKEVGGQAGGHKSAAGAYIDKDKEEEFIRSCERVLSEENGES